MPEVKINEDYNKKNNVYGDGKVDEAVPTHADTEEYSEVTKRQFIKSVSSRHRTLMRYLIAGKTYKEISETLGYSSARISLIANSPLFQEEMEKMRVEIDKTVVSLEGELAHMDGGVSATLQDEARASLQTIIDLRDRASSERVKQVSALEILDRAGYSKTEKVHNTVELDVSDGLLAAIQTAMKEMGKPKPDNGGKESNGDTK